LIVHVDAARQEGVMAEDRGSGKDWLWGTHGRRVRVGAAAAGLVVVVVLVLVLALGGDRSPSSVRSVSPASLAEAAAVTTREPGYKLSLYASSMLGSQTLGASSSVGTFEGGSRLRGKMSETTNGKVVSAIFIGPYVYAREPTSSSGAARWYRVNLNTLRHAIGNDTPFDPDSSPLAALQYLHEVGSVTVVGTARIAGVLTTHYDGEVDVARASELAAGGDTAAAREATSFVERISGKSTEPVQVWVDAHQLVRRIETTQSVCTHEGTFTVRDTLNLSNFGPQPAVQPPPPSEVTDVTGKVAAAAAKAGAELACRPGSASTTRLPSVIGPSTGPTR
jgi:hypothetical protein